MFSGWSKFLNFILLAFAFVALENMDSIAKDRLLSSAAYKTITPKPYRPSTPFYFVLDRSPRLDIKKLVFVNRLMRIVPHHGLALLTFLSEKKLIGDRVKNDMPREQTRRYLQ